MSVRRLYWPVRFDAVLVLSYNPERRTACEWQEYACQQTLSYCRLLRGIAWPEQELLISGSAWALQCCCQYTRLPFRASASARGGPVQGRLWKKIPLAPSCESTPCERMRVSKPFRPFQRIVKRAPSATAGNRPPRPPRPSCRRLERSRWACRKG